MFLRIKLLLLQKFSFCAAGWIGRFASSHRKSQLHSALSFLTFPKWGGGVNSMEEKQYLSPAVQVLELYSEGVLCASSGTETLEENEGIW